MFDAWCANVGGRELQTTIWLEYVEYRKTAQNQQNKQTTTTTTTKKKWREKIGKIEKNKYCLEQTKAD